MIRSRLTYANVMSTVAVFLALGGGIAWALATDSVKSKHIKDDQVKTADVRNEGLPGGGLGGQDIAPDALGGDDINESTLGQVPTAADADNAFNANNATSADNADALGGIGPGGFVQGSATVYSNRLTLPNDAQTRAILEIPDIGRFYAQCEADNDLVTGFFNNTGSNIYVIKDDGGTNPSEVYDLPNLFGTGGSVTSGLDRLIIQAGRDEAGAHDLATIIATGQGGVNPCVVQAQATVHLN